MRKILSSFVFLPVFAAVPAMGQTPAPSDKLSDYLVDLGSGPVSAADIIGVSSAAVTQIQSLKDFSVLLSPLKTGDEKAAFGAQVAPARLPLFRVSANDYLSSSGIRAASSISLSYAENRKSIDDKDYKQNAAAIHISYYPFREDDPIVAAHMAFSGCKALFGIEAKKATGLLDALKALSDSLKRPLTPDELSKATADYNQSAAFIKLSSDADAAIKGCVASKATAKWNATLLSATYGKGWIKAPDAGRLSLGRTASVDAVVGLGDVAAINLSVHRTRKAVELDSLSSTPTYKSSTLVGMRATYKGTDDGDLLGLAEVSNAKSSDSTANGQVFRYALGIDKRVAEGFWLELRVGRKREADGNDMETKGLLNLTWSSTPKLPKLFASQ